MNRYRALVLDMDGTLLDSRQALRDSFFQLGQEYGFVPTEEHLHLAFAWPSQKIIASMGLPDVEGISRRWQEIMIDMADRVSLFPGVRALFEAPVLRGIVTSEARHELAKNFKVLNIPEDRFACTVTAHDTPFQKPRPEPLLHCLSQMGVAPDEALFVGDSLLDHDCALAAGVDFGLAVWGASPDDHFAHARYHFQGPEEILRDVCFEKPPC